MITYDSSAQVSESNSFLSFVFLIYSTVEAEILVEDLILLFSLTVKTNEIISMMNFLT